MRQIVALQNQLKGLYEKLSQTPPKDIEQRLLLQRQIQGIEDEIAALQAALISTENKKVMQLQKVQSDKDTAARAAKALATGSAVTAPRPATDAGAVKPLSADTKPTDSANPGAPAIESGDAGYTSSGESDTADGEPVGANVDVMA